MTSWTEFEQAEPDFAARVRTSFTAHRHHTIATLRADGSPRISGIEVEFADGELTFGSMPGARKGADLRRDPRFALHSATVDPPPDSPTGWPGEAKLAGRARSVGPLDGPVEGDAFVVELTEVVHTRLTPAGDKLLIEYWRPGRPLGRVERE